jgi:hypothetical protein
MKSLGDQLFASKISDGHAKPTASYKRVSARDLSLKETWFRDAIFHDPELVIAPCRAAGRVDPEESWLPWRTEINFGSGPIDVLLVSSYGRIGIVETKLSYNPQKRREVVAQVLDYALSLQDIELDDLPDLPLSELAPVEEDLRDSVAAGRFLLIIAGDALDPRALRLSQSLLARHLTNEWDLAMIDLNVYQSSLASDNVLIVPELLGTVQADVRQVVRVVVEGESPKARIIVDRVVEDVDSPSRGSRLQSVDEFLERMETVAPGMAATAIKITSRFAAIAERGSGRIEFALQRNSANLYWVTTTGPKRMVTFRTDGRFRIVTRYLRMDDQHQVIETIRNAARPTLNLGPDDGSAGTRLSNKSAASLLAMLDRIELALCQ